MAILVTGGTGYIGSHTVVELLNAEKDVVIVDDLRNSKAESLNRIEKITSKRPVFYRVDVCEGEKLEEVFQKHHITDVIHFAGLKAVGESVAKPLEYYQNNIDSTLTLLKLMRKYEVKNLVFSSSATVYGKAEKVPIDETSPIGNTTNPYGTTKLMIEIILKDVHQANPNMNIAILRYFNPIGAHPSGLIGEDPRGIPNNLMPYIAQVALGKLPVLNVYGNDYQTVDGTGVRDYIHVVDLARGHVSAILKLQEKPGLVIYNLGTGKGTSVLELVEAFKRVNQVQVPYVISARRPGDIDACYAGVEKAFKEMGWKAVYGIEEGCRDAWNFQKKNPQGL
ncbi:MAG: UDP-glucose 4-epimerase GalE [Bacilli bacterium]|jgi:UDP-glucose 4-epimerase